MTTPAINGIIPPMVTPFDGRGRVDEDAFRADVRYLVKKAGVAGLAEHIRQRT